MVEAVGGVIESALGLAVEVQALTIWQMALRAGIIYLAVLVMVRLGDKRFLGKHTAFDVILGIVLGSVASRAINGSAPFFETIGAGFVLVGLHWLFAAIAFRTDRFGALFKGHPRMLIQDGEIQWAAMRAGGITERDLTGALRLHGKLSDPRKVKVACLERSGDISVIPSEDEPQVIEIAVEAGVQTVRIALQGK